MPTTRIPYGEGSSSEISLWDTGAHWDDNSGAIPLWAARLSTPTWGIEWARAHLPAGTPVVLECYMHQLSHEERLEQVAFMIESTRGEDTAG